MGAFLIFLSTMIQDSSSKNTSAKIIQSFQSEKLLFANKGFAKFCLLASSQVLFLKGNSSSSSFCFHNSRSDSSFGALMLSTQLFILR